jgi:5'-methylthioadenosine phosphorylase
MILGVLGGSGLYDIDGLTDARSAEVSTPFGAPSGPLLGGRIGDARVLFLPRHGPGHRFSPSEINYRANVFALKAAGATQVLSVSAVGSLREGMPPGDLVLPDQFIDKTYRRASTFFGDGVVGHVSFAEPTCPGFSAAVAAAAVETGFVEAPPTARLAEQPRGSGKRLHRGGTYVCMEGPQFSTRAESLLHRSWGADLIGMTAVTEAKLCREAEVCFASLALVTDYDCWHAEEEAVTAAGVVAVLAANVAGAKEIVRRLPPHASFAADCGCARAAAHAILTAPGAITPEARQRLRALHGREI